MSEVVRLYSVAAGGLVDDERLDLSKKEWKERLDPDEYHVLREHGTERAFTGRDWDSKDPGVYRCAGCGNDLFLSDAKYDSGTGWPSFWQPVHENNVENRDDRSFFMRRTEVVCARCGGHLGHVFPDGPPPTGQRYCMNGTAMRLRAAAAADPDDAGS